MNDPGLDEPISNDAKDVENQVNDEHDEKEEDEQAFLEPRQVFFSPETASVTCNFPSAIMRLHLCPFSSALSAKKIRASSLALFL
jgi:hypothetical protein